MLSNLVKFSRHGASRGLSLFATAELFCIYTDFTLQLVEDQSERGPYKRDWSCFSSSCVMLSANWTKLDTGLRRRHWLTVRSLRAFCRSWTSRLCKRSERWNVGDVMPPICSAAAAAAAATRRAVWKERALRRVWVGRFTESTDRPARPLDGCRCEVVNFHKLHITPMSVDRPRYYSIEPTRRRRTDHTHTLPPALLVLTRWMASSTSCTNKSGRKFKLSN